MTKLSKPAESSQPKDYQPVEWTWLKLISICLLGSLAFYSTNQINWDTIKVEHIIATSPGGNTVSERLSELRAKRSAESQINSKLANEAASRAKRNTIQKHDNNKLVEDVLNSHKSLESNSHLPALDFSLYEPIEAVESHEIHKRAVEHYSKEEDGRPLSKLQKYFFEDYVNVPLSSLNQIKVSNGKYSVSFYTQGVEDPPSEFLGEEDEGLEGLSNYYSSAFHKKSGAGTGEHFLERNFMIARHEEDNFDHEHVLLEMPRLSVKKYHVSDATYDDDPVRYYNRDGSDQMHFLDLLAQSGAQGAYKNLEDIIDDLSITDASMAGGYRGSSSSDYRPTSRNVRYESSELPCLKKEPEVTFDGWMSRSFQYPMEAEEKHGGGNGGKQKFDDELIEVKAPAGPPVGCCNGRPHSAKKSCCCRRKSYDTENEFCCVSKNGCAAFQTFNNNTENREACLNIGGNIVMHEYFDYQATPMIGWAANRPYGPAMTSSQFNTKVDNEMQERYYDFNNDTPNRRTTPNSNPANYNWFKYNEMQRQLEENYNTDMQREVRFRTPNARDAYQRDQLTSRDHIEDMRAGYNPMGREGSDRGHQIDQGIYLGDLARVGRAPPHRRGK